MMRFNVIVTLLLVISCSLPIAQEPSEIAKVTDISFESQGTKGLLRIIASDKVKYEVKRLKSPHRILVDIFHSELAFPRRELDIGEGGIEAIRASQFKIQPPVVRVVVDVVSPLEYRIISLKETKEIILELKLGTSKPEEKRELVKDIEIKRIEVSKPSERSCQVNIYGACRANYRTMFLKNPARLVFDFKNALLSRASEEIPVNSPLLSAIRMSQYQREPHNIVRLVLDLASWVPYRVSYEDNPHRMTIYLETGDLSNKVILIDPGHGGEDPGAIGLNGLQEKEVNLDIARRLKALLRDSKVLLTRSEDVFVSLSDRVNMANQNKVDLFVSIHCNSCAIQNKHSGTETYYYNPQSFPLAEAVHTELVKALKLKDGGVKQRMYYVVHHTAMPAILVECAYINHTQEGLLLADPEFRQKIAQAIYDGLRNYVQGIAIPNQISEGAE